MAEIIKEFISTNESASVEVLKLDKIEKSIYEEDIMISISVAFINWQSIDEFENLVNWLNETYNEIKSKYK